MSEKKSIDNDSPTIGFRVHPLLYEWIKAQAIDGESPHQVVRRLIQELAVNDGICARDGISSRSYTQGKALVDISLIKDRTNNQVDQRVAILETRMATFEDSLQQLKRDIVHFNQR
jgi:hypothetical protein